MVSGRIGGISGSADTLRRRNENGFKRTKVLAVTPIPWTRKIKVDSSMSKDINSAAKLYFEEEK